MFEPQFRVPGPAIETTERLFVGHSELARLIASFDWASTPIGLPQHWPQSLKTAVRIMLTSQQPIWIGWGSELIYLYNDPYKSIIGGKHPWALGRPTSVVWREIWDDIAPLLDKAMSGDEGTYTEAQLLIMERNGFPEETYYTFSYSPIPDTDGSPGGIFCANTDDTQRVISERQLLLLRELASSAAEARSVQEACERSAGALATDPKDLPFAMIYLADTREEVARLAALSGIDAGHPAARPTLRLDGGEPWPLSEIWESRKAVIVDLAGVSRSEFPAGGWRRPPGHAIVLPIASSGDASLAGFLIAGLNPFRLYDDRYASFLDLVAAQIAAAISNGHAYEEERRRAEALAEIDRAKTAFFSNVSHEFRTPLTLMLSPLEEVLVKAGGQLPGEYRTLLDIAHRNGTRLLKLVNTLLDFARIEAGRVTAAYEPVDLAAFTAELASNFRSAMEKAGLRLVIDPAPLPQPVYVDRDMWEKIVLNLLSNAFKFTFVGTITVEVRAADHAQAEVVVRDTGTGIPPAELPHVFERFRRVEGARGRSFEGSGIGLALVQELVKLHGGRIQVESEIDRGSAFTIRIPFGSTHLSPERLNAAPGHAHSNVRAQAYLDEALGWLDGNASVDRPAASSTDDFGLVASSAPERRHRVLLADDNTDMRDYVRRLLSDQYDVEAVGDGQAALEAAWRQRPDLVLSDIMMPRLDGLGLLNAMRNDRELREVPIIFLSARAGEEARVEGLRMGADDYLVKPFSARELLARVAANIELSATRAERAKLLQEESHVLELLNKVGTTVAAELDLDRAVQIVTDAATELTGAAFGSFFYNVINQQGESYMLYPLSGVSREAFAGFPMPRNTAVFAPTFSGEGIIRSDDILHDPRYGKNHPHGGMPKGHLPVRSYLAAPVVSRSGEVLGGLFFGHPEPGRFDERSERLVLGIAAQAAVAIDNARLFQAAERELSERRRAEAALQTLNATLEKRVLDEVNERTKAEAQLRQVQKMEAVGQLTGGIAHDFNNMLAVIIGGLNLLQRKLAKGETDVGRFVESAIDGARRAAALTQRLLAFSRQQALSPEAFNPNRMIAGMTDLLSRTIGEHINVETVLAAGLWPVKADAGQLENAVLNLCVNARDAMPDGGKLTVETSNAYVDEIVSREYALAPGQYVLIAVADNGVGMRGEVIARAFDPFFTTKEVGRGTGLGLSQVYGFVRQSGGHVKIYSEVDVGTTVKIYLPRHYGEPTAEQARLGPDAPYRGLKSELILVVEDEERVRVVSVEALRDLGYSVVGAANPAEALQLLESGLGVSLLFTDVIMPAMSGSELADRARDQVPGLKVLYTTGYTRNAITHNGFLDPGTSLLSKPFTVDELAMKVRHILDS
ncbi:ATP-binding protein [Bradyrhizobium sp. NP1]|uniref:ATP-binding protein n=1 Tax=Bradyrhizobium sp. NP1 TaxID=3049772 RepID=UPI0025A640C4|nr:ATP-binding protein [Bradyrhizobium sp. NP1]WJR80004.1 ATP-binding protein [Bradyrhizobium sp. NP1]